MTQRICSIEGCEAKHASRGYCRAHGRRLRLYGDPLGSKPFGCPAGDAHPAWQGNEVGYSAVHRRLREHRGSAKELACVSCGDAATGWAYQHTSTDEQVCPDTGNAYTTDLTHYEPMCSPCHRAFDNWLGRNFSREHAGGVCYDKRRGSWRAYATWEKRQYTAGSYPTKEQAAQAAAAKRDELMVAMLNKHGWLDRLDRTAG